MSITAVRSVPSVPTVQRRMSPTRWAALGFAVAWAAGLSVASSSTDVRSSGAAVLASFRGHHSSALAQYVLTEGITAVLLVLAVGPIWRTCRSVPTRATLRAATYCAAGVSIVECVLGSCLVTDTSTAHAAATLNAAINRLDGTKMLLLALVVALAARSTARGQLPLPHWTAGLGVVTALTLAVSGIGYAVLDTGLASAAWASLPLLIADVLVVAFTVSTSGHRRTRGSTTRR